MMPNDTKKCSCVCVWAYDFHENVLTIRTGITRHVENVWCNPLESHNFLVFATAEQMDFTRCGFIGFLFSACETIEKRREKKLRRKMLKSSKCAQTWKNQKEIVQFNGNQKISNKFFNLKFQTSRPLLLLLKLNTANGTEFNRRNSTMTSLSSIESMIKTANQRLVTSSSFFGFFWTSTVFQCEHTHTHTRTHYTHRIFFFTALLSFTFSICMFFTFLLISYVFSLHFHPPASSTPATFVYIVLNPRLLMQKCDWAWNWMSSIFGRVRFLAFWYALLSNWWMCLWWHQFTFTHTYTV